MSLSEFKIIFYWEYIHRLLARIIGLFFLIPLIYFSFFQKDKSKIFEYLLFSIFLNHTQGIVGWLMVKSGLVDDITVSHYRLSIHLTIAVTIISIIFWLIKNTIEKNNKIFLIFKKKFTLFILILLFFSNYFWSICIWLDAGKIYQTWPLMGYSYFPNDINY
jgi:cytochrome c oxidase assembly protein subunit 15